MAAGAAAHEAGVSVLHVGQPLEQSMVHHNGKASTLEVVFKLSHQPAYCKGLSLDDSIFLFCLGQFLAQIHNGAFPLGGVLGQYHPQHHSGGIHVENVRLAG